MGSYLLILFPHSRGQHVIKGKENQFKNKFQIIPWNSVNNL